MTKPIFCAIFDSESVRQFDISVSNIGGKAHSLLELANAGLPVPPACVFPVQICVDYFANNQKLSDEFWKSLRAALTALEQATDCLFEDKSRPLGLAVRSGSPVSMPGAMQTVLGVRNWPELIQAVNSVLESWMSPAAQAFRQARNLQHLTGTALLIQQMIETEVAGVLFTQDPTGTRDNCVCIEAVAGRGDSLVSGAATGQRWTVCRTGWAVRRESADNYSEELLSSQQIEELARQGMHLERQFRQPVDVEWGLQNGELIFFQSRPIVFSPQSSDVGVEQRSSKRNATDHGTFLQRSDELSMLVARENAKFAQARLAGNSCWVRHSLSESLPYPTPMTWSMIRDFMKGNGGFGRLYQSLGFSPSRAICRDGFLELIAGQIYASPDRLPDLFCADFPFSFDREELERNAAVIDRAPSRLDLDRVGPWFLLCSPHLVWVFLRSTNRLQRLRRTAESHYEQDVLPKYRSFLQQEKDRSLTRLSVSELVQTLHIRLRTVLQEFAPRLMLPGVVGAIVFELFSKNLERLIGESPARSQCQAQLQHLRIPHLIELQQALTMFKEQAISASNFLSRYGHRADHEMELAEPRWRENPQRIAAWATSSSHQETTAWDVDEARNVLEKLLQSHKNNRQHRQLREQLSDALRLLPYREAGKHEFLRGYELLRETVEQIGRITGLENDIYFLNIEELQQADFAQMSEQIEQRKRERELWRSFPQQEFIGEDGLTCSLPSSNEQSLVLKGTVISCGTATGTAWLPTREAVSHPTDTAVLICSTLPPHLVTMFCSLRAIVVDQAALLSHGAILARQFAIPAVQLPKATQLIRQGDRISVDGKTGLVSIERMS